MPMLLAALLAGQAYQVPRSVIDAPPACAADAALPGDYRGWRDLAAEPGVGRAFDLRSIDPAIVRLAIPLDTSRHPGRIALATITVRRAGTYRVAIDQGAWIDLFSANRTALTSIAHAHGPECSGIRKVVTFRLRRGRYNLGLTGVTGPSVRVLVAAEPVLR